MKSPFLWIPENVMFAVLAFVLAAWMTGSIATAPAAPRATLACNPDHGTPPARMASAGAAHGASRCIG